MNKKICTHCRLVLTQQVHLCPRCQQPLKRRPRISMKQILLSCICPLRVPEGDGDPLRIEESDLLPAHSAFVASTRKAAVERGLSMSRVAYWLSPLRGEAEAWLLDYGVEEPLAWLVTT